MYNVIIIKIIIIKKKNNEILIKCEPPVYTRAQCTVQRQKKKRKRLGQYNSNNKLIQGQYIRRYNLHLSLSLSLSLSLTHTHTHTHTHIHTHILKHTHTHTRVHTHTHTHHSICGSLVSYLILIAQQTALVIR